MKVLHYTKTDGEAEYIIFAEEGDDDIEDNCIHGYELSSSFDVPDEDIPGVFPINHELHRK